MPSAKAEQELEIPFDLLEGRRLYRTPALYETLRYETKMPDYLVLLSTLGGLSVFGLAGVVIGPLVAALFLVVWEMLAEERASSVTDQARTDLPAS